MGRVGRFPTASDGRPTTSMPASTRFIWMLNGEAWPATERIHAAVGDSLRWRIVNATLLPHPMHLHGFLLPRRRLRRPGGGEIRAAAGRADRGDPAPLAVRDDGDDLIADARGELALPLPHRSPQHARLGV